MQNIYEAFCLRDKDIVHYHRRQWNQLLLYYCIVVRTPSIVRELLRKHLDAYKSGSIDLFPIETFDTPLLHKICSRDDRELLECFLLYPGVDITVVDSYLCNIAHVIAANGSERCLELLLDFSKSKVVELCAKKDIYGNNAFVIGFRCCNYHILDIMLYHCNKNILVNSRKSNGETCLHIAAKHLDPQACQYLIQKDAKFLRNDSGNTPAIVAIKQTKERNRYYTACYCYCLLVKYSTLKNIDEMLLVAIRTANIDFIRVVFLMFPTTIKKVLSKIALSALDIMDAKTEQVVRNILGDDINMVMN